MKLTDPKKNRDTSDKYRVQQYTTRNSEAYYDPNGAPNGELSSGISASAAMDGIDGLAWEVCHPEFVH
jgi:hypothetical protein